jgi:superkiller protein 3
MANDSHLSKLKNLFSRRNLTLAGVGAVVIVIVLLSFTAYYYFTTPASTIIVTTTDFPTGLSTSFTADNLTNHVIARLQEMIRQADANDATGTSLLQGLGPRPTRQTTIPLRALSNTPSPIFQLKWHGVDLNLCRRIARSLRAREFVELSVIGLPKDQGWRIVAFRKEWPQFSPSPAGSAPQPAGACTDFENCANDLSEQILKSLDQQRLLRFYIKKRTPEAALRILELYQSIPTAQLDEGDLIAWGNAFFTRGQLNDALQKYQEALEKKPDSCQAHVARGFIYYSRPDGDQLLSNLKRAEQDFRTGISCDERNEYTRTTLCHTLLRQWRAAENKDPQTLEEAKQQCQKALEINHQFVPASINLAYVLYRQDKYDESLALFEQLSQRYPTSSILFVNYGYFEYLKYLRTNDQNSLRQAITQTLQAWTLDSKSDLAASNLGFFYYEQGEFKRALQFLNNAKELVSDDADCLAGLALVTEKLGNRDAALAYLKQAIQADPHYRDPDYLRRNNNWSTLAAQDLAALVALIPT